MQIAVRKWLAIAGLIETGLLLIGWANPACAQSPPREAAVLAESLRQLKIPKFSDCTPPPCPTQPDCQMREDTRACNKFGGLPIKDPNCEMMKASQNSVFRAQYDACVANFKASKMKCTADQAQAKGTCEAQKQEVRLRTIQDEGSIRAFVTAVMAESKSSLDSLEQIRLAEIFLQRDYKSIEYGVTLGPKDLPSELSAFFSEYGLLIIDNSVVFRKGPFDPPVRRDWVKASVLMRAVDLLGPDGYVQAVIYAREFFIAALSKSVGSGCERVIC